MLCPPLGSQAGVITPGGSFGRGWSTRGRGAGGAEETGSLGGSPSPLPRVYPGAASSGGSGSARGPGPGARGTPPGSSAEGGGALPWASKRVTPSSSSPAAAPAERKRGKGERRDACGRGVRRRKGGKEGGGAPRGDSVLAPEALQLQGSLPSWQQGAASENSTMPL